MEGILSDYLYTKYGIPLKVSGQRVYNSSGYQFGRIKGSKVYGSDGRYVGTIVGDRLIYRSTDSASMGSPFTPSVSSPTARAQRAASALWGGEPDYQGRPVTIIRVTHCDGRDSTDVRYPPFVLYWNNRFDPVGWRRAEWHLLSRWVAWVTGIRYPHGRSSTRRRWPTRFWLTARVSCGVPGFRGCAAC